MYRKQGYRGGKRNAYSLEDVAEMLAKKATGETKEVFKQEFLEIYKQTEHQPPVITTDDIAHELPYQEAIKLLKLSTHIGQRKLFLNEVQFCTEYVGTKPDAVVFYAGAAPNIKGAYFASLFPNMRFVFIDPNKFQINTEKYSREYTPRHWFVPSVDKSAIGTAYEKRLSAEQVDDICRQIANGDDANTEDDPDCTGADVNGKYRINIINDLMTVDLAIAINKYFPENYFISDIRTNIDENSPDAIDILWNDAQQLNWITEMKPQFAMLKFRHPFYNQDEKAFYDEAEKEPRKSDFALAKVNGIDFVENFKTKTLQYFAGKVYIQPWAGVSSTESRLVTDCKEIINYGTPDTYDNKYYYHNCLSRNYTLFQNDNADHKLGFDHCADCAIENNIWTRYVEVFNCSRTVKDYVHELSTVTFRHLARENHGNLFKHHAPSFLLSKLNAMTHH